VPVLSLLWGGGATPVSSRCGTKRPPTGSQSALPVAAAADCM